MDPVKSEVWLWFKGRREKEVLREKIPSIFTSIFTSVSSSNHWHYNNTLMIKHHHCPTFRISKAWSINPSEAKALAEKQLNDAKAMAQEKCNLQWDSFKGWVLHWNSFKGMSLKILMTSSGSKTLTCISFPFQLKHHPVTLGFGGKTFESWEWNF